MNNKDNMIPFIMENIRIREEEFGLMVFSNRTPVLTFNQDAAIIWRQIDNNKTVIQISNEIDCIKNGEGNSNLEVIRDFLEACNKLRLVSFRNKV